MNCPTCHTNSRVLVEGHPCVCCWPCVDAAMAAKEGTKAHGRYTTLPGSRECAACAAMKVKKTSRNPRGGKTSGQRYAEKIQNDLTWRDTRGYDQENANSWTY